MSHSFARIRGIFVGAGVAGALGFGAVQAFASPQSAAPAAACVDAVCSARCLAGGRPGGGCGSLGCFCY